jgi:hypothetical protein
MKRPAAVVWHQSATARLAHGAATRLAVANAMVVPTVPTAPGPRVLTVWSTMPGRVQLGQDRPGRGQRAKPGWRVRWRRGGTVDRGGDAGALPR